MNWLKNQRLVIKLNAAFILIAAIVALVGGLGVLAEGVAKDGLLEMYENQLLPIKYTMQANEEAIYLNRDLLQYVAETEQKAMDGVEQNMQSHLRVLEEQLQLYRATSLTLPEVEALKKVAAAWPPYLESAKKVMLLSYKDHNKEALMLLNDDTRPKFKVVDDILSEIVDINVKIAKKTLDDALVAHETTKAKLVALILGAVGVALALGTGLSKKIGKELGGEPAAAAELARRIAVGDLSRSVALKMGDERSLMAAMQQMSLRIKAVAERAEAIGRGDFSQEVVLLSEQDQLGRSINAMNAMLRDAKQGDERRNWLRDGASQLSSAMTGDFSMQQLANTATAMLGRYLGAGRGVLHFYNRSDETLELLGSYMYSERSHLGSRFKLGEGAIGQVAKEKKPIILTTVAADAAPIVTGTTCARPQYTYTYPLLREDQLLGVLEFASFERFDDAREELLRNAAEVVASFLFIAEQRESVRKLLVVAEDAEKETRAQSDDLRTANGRLEEQQQLLQQQSEELQQSNAQMEEQQQQLQQQNQELREARRLMEAKASQLEQASQYKSDFLANMSHELRTPLNSIILLSKMMSSNEQAVDPAEIVKWSQIINRSGEDLLHLINDVLDLSKVEAGRMDLQCVRVSSAGLILELQEQFEHTARERGLTFVAQDQLCSEFVTDRNKLAQIMRNLLSNAMKFTKQGSVTLTLSRRIGEQLPICLSVCDSGIGIAPQEQALIFEAFQQVDGSTSREYGGTGLGLTISLRFAQLLGGTITLKSAPGQGSEFLLLLPETAPRSGSIQTAATAAKATIIASPPPAGNEAQAGAALDDRATLVANDRVILLIDDDPGLGHILMTLNRGLGYKTLLASTGAEGLLLARQCHPHGILLDLGLPDMKGTQVLHELKSSRELSTTPVYIVSARDRDETLLRDGALGFLQKPFTERQLAQAEVALLRALAPVVGSPILVVENGSITAADLTRIVGAEAGRVVAVAPDAAMAEVQRRHASRLAVIDFGETSLHASLEIAAALRAESPELALVFFGRRALSDDEMAQLRYYSDSVIVQAAQAERRLLENIQRFLVDVPKKPPMLSAAALTPIESKRLVGRHILVVDDDPRNLFVMSAALERQGAKVSGAVNGKRALEFLSGQRVDLIMMDVMMPEMDGYQTIAALRKIPDLASIPVLAITAKALPTDRAKLLAAGADDFLPKPVDHDKLIALTEQWCAGRTP